MANVWIRSLRGFSWRRLRINRKYKDRLFRYLFRDKEHLHLSDAFDGGRDSGCLECRALMLNINRGHNQELLHKCRRLWEYSEFIAEVNDLLAKGYPLKKAVTLAMNNCIEKEILKDVLERSRAEIMSIFLTEYNEKSHMKGIYQDGYADGEKAGYDEGEKAGIESGRRSMLEEMIVKKWKKGKSIETIAEDLDVDYNTVKLVVEKLSSN